MLVSRKFFLEGILIPPFGFLRMDSIRNIHVCHPPAHGPVLSEVFAEDNVISDGEQDLPGDD
jgi:hypothetical protein